MVEVVQEPGDQGGLPDSGLTREDHDPALPARGRGMCPGERSQRILPLEEVHMATILRARVSFRRPPVRLEEDHVQPRRATMKYMLLIHQGDTPTPRDPDSWAKLSEDQQKAVYADYQAINETPGVTPGIGLGAPETATTVRVDGGQTLVTDGPFVSVKEALGGWLVYEAADLDAAIELAARVPAARLGGAVEIRPVEEW